MPRFIPMSIPDIMTTDKMIDSVILIAPRFGLHPPFEYASRIHGIHSLLADDICTIVFDGVKEFKDDSMTKEDAARIVRFIYSHDEDDVMVICDPMGNFFAASIAMFFEHDFNESNDFMKDPRYIVNTDVLSKLLDFHIENEYPTHWTTSKIEAAEKSDFDGFVGFLSGDAK